MARRSRSGCHECRRRHRSYAVRLSWGGRPFKKSVFGKCLDGQVDKIPSDSSTRNRGASSFVYGSASPLGAANRKQIHTSKSPSCHNDHVESGSESMYNRHSLPDASSSCDYRGYLQHYGVNGTVQSPSTSPSWIPPVYMALLDHFLVKMTRSLSCHDGIQKDLCSMILPMALETSHLFAAVLLVSANHRVSLGLEQSLVQIEHLRTTSLTQLRESLAVGSLVAQEATMVTTLMLCLSEMVSGGNNLELWRVHLHGARAILGSDGSAKKRDATWDLLKRFYMSIECIASSCGMLTKDVFLICNEPSDEHYIDDLTGFSTTLLPIFEEINNLTKTPVSTDRVCFTSFTRETCKILVDKVEDMLSHHELKFAPGLENMLSPLERFDFFVLDEAYHHMALLHLYFRACGIFEQRIQRSVSAIISCINQMSFIDGPCPGAAVLPPLFIAGRHASNTDDRQSIMSLLHKSEMFFGMGNVKSARNTLKQLWTSRDCLVQEEEDGENASKKWQNIICKHHISFHVTHEAHLIMSYSFQNVGLASLLRTHTLC
ncbi:uncharacterized protein PAC_15117 [Phialocephala subalpina]|uniref:Uncharacterized protein n=1 Tax=Phialocephala subalpina TaxID=576137 RepID=A0A1L7XJT1_9HELO|nr:uncharacterized protein PAC_15117 [Phialocephala subalpina]